MTQETFTTQELADRWALKVGTLQLWRIRKEGPDFVKLGNSKSSPVIYTREAIERYEKEHIRQSTSDEQK